ncbi:acyltransferase family protein [Capsulimonas corticalis]|uniref:acyltransferase family protein n=1 Tax=Capsulimonas corticalis TaxID=2219043 RepID=UPI002619FC3E|nr:acyltransferase [Capsulimonas corticalis]
MDHLDGLRAIAAIYVMCAHGLSEQRLAIFSYAHAAVTVFIVLSGFCLMLPVARSGDQKGGIIAFFIRRGRRILPPYYAAFALCIAAAPLAAQAPPARDFPRSFAEHLFLTHDFGPFPYAISAPLWSVAVEWHIYLIFPVLAWAALRWGPIKMAAGALLLSLAAEHWSPLKSPSMHYYGDFAIGAAGAFIAYSQETLSRSIRNQTRWPIFAGLIAVAMGVSLTALGAERYETIRDIVDLPISLMTVAVLIACAVPGGERCRRILSRTWLAGLGSFSYSIYLIHAPVLAVIHHFAPISGTETAATVVGILELPIVVAAAFVFYWIFERPFTVKGARSPALKTASLTSASDRR